MKIPPDPSKPAIGKAFIIVLLLSWVAPAFALLEAIPKFTEMFHDMDVALPVPTALVCGAGAFFQRIFPLGFGIVLAPALAFLAWWLRDRDRRRLVDWASQAPDAIEEVRERDVRTRRTALFILLGIWLFQLLILASLFLPLQILMGRISASPTPPAPAPAPSSSTP